MQRSATSVEQLNTTKVDKLLSQKRILVKLSFFNYWTPPPPTRPLPSVPDSPPTHNWDFYRFHRSSQWPALRRHALFFQPKANSPIFICSRPLNIRFPSLYLWLVPILFTGKMKVVDLHCQQPLVIQNTIETFKKKQINISLGSVNLLKGFYIDNVVFC